MLCCKLFRTYAIVTSDYVGASRIALFFLLNYRVHNGFGMPEVHLHPSGSPVAYGGNPQYLPASPPQGLPYKKKCAVVPVVLLF